MNFNQYAVCPPGLWAVSSTTVRRYHVVNEPKTMAEAQRHCREKHKDLVTIRGLEDLETLKTLVDTSGMVSYVSFMTSERSAFTQRKYANELNLSVYLYFI